MRPLCAHSVFLLQLAGLLLLPAGIVCGADTELSGVTFSKDVAPILYAHCVRCHHAGDVAPMPLLTYKDTRPWASAIRQVVVTRKMPPWQADSAPGQFVNDPRLNEHEIETIRVWVQSGAKEGEVRDLPAPPSFPDGWKIGEPDAIVPIPADYVVEPNARDQYVYLRAPTNFTEDRWVTAVELRPGNRQVVHHAHVYVYSPPKPSKAGEQKEQPATEPFVTSAGLRHINPAMPVVDDGCASADGGNVPGNVAHEGNILGSYLPGKEPDVFAPGYARLVPKGAVLEFQIHYNAAAVKTRTTDRTSVGFIFSKEPPKQVLRRLDIPNYLFLIPPGAADQRVTSCYVFDRDIELMSYTAHMHLRGKDMTMEAQHPDGRRETLVAIPRYDFNWQTEYRLREPVAIEKGTKIMITAHFDNSPNNRYNPDPSKTVRWGEPSDEEMMDGWLEFILPTKPRSDAVAAMRH